jgi:3-oxoacyl-[acyl-carrier-protein] synthase-3
MAFIKYKNVSVKAITACVPKTVASNYDLDYLLSKEENQKMIDAVGIKERRIADGSVTASDLCFKAAEHLLSENHIDRQSIDLVLFLSQLPDYKIPATAPLLQTRLGLPTTTAAMDLSLGCSGYVYALSTAMAYASMEGINRVLLLVGETFSKIVNRMDKVNVPLYGDAGTATLVEKDVDSKGYFLLGSDGNGRDAVIVKAGEARYPVTAENLKVREAENGNMRADTEVYMDGMDVFNFALRTVPKSVKSICEANGTNLNDVDFLVLHQANKFMTDFIVKRLKYPLDRVPYCLDKYGNTSSASIPLTIASELSGRSLSNVVLCGFGAGLSWGSALLNLSHCNVLPVIEY